MHLNLVRLDSLETGDLFLHYTLTINGNKRAVEVIHMCVKKVVVNKHVEVVAMTVKGMPQYTFKPDFMVKQIGMSARELGKRIDQAFDNMHNDVHQMRH